MLRRVPPLEAAEAFIVAARAGNMRAAAEQLALSPSALSRRVQALENFVGATLFIRRHRGLTLTPEGKTYLAKIENAMDALAEAAFAIKADGEILKIAASHTLTSEWLLPRLPRLLSELGIPVEIVVGDPLPALREGHADIALCGGFIPPGGFDVRTLASCKAALVAAPDFSQDRKWTGLKLARPHFPEMQAPLIADASPETGFDINLASLARTPTILFATLQMAYEAAASGIGVALAVPLSSERFLAHDRVRVCTGTKCDIDASYWMVTRQDTVSRMNGRRKSVQAWLAQEASQSLTRHIELTLAN
jgi:LysR family glycine cleavage system transcriptional activator